ncbi:DUF2066 domain-containing protein [Marinobacter sp. 1Y8]
MKSVPTIPFRKLILGFLMLIPLMAHAVSVDGLYRTQVAVGGSSDSEQKAAYAEGLRRVLLRVSGSREVLNSDQIGGLLANAESFLQAYQYRRVNGGSDQLLMTFGSVGVNQALANMQVPVWGANRPLTLAWIAVDSGRDRHILTAPDAGAGDSDRARWSAAFASASSDRGLPLSLPPSTSGDDRALLSEIRGNFMDSLKSASTDYPHNLMTVVNVTRRGGGWEASWQLEGAAFTESGTETGAASPEVLANAVVGAWADLLAARYSVDAGKISDAQRVDLVIENVASVEAYGALKRSLESMTPVVSAGPVRVTDKVSTWRVAFSGELSVLKEYIALDTRFKAVEGGTTQVSPAQPSKATGTAARDAQSSPDSQRAPAGASSADAQNAVGDSATSNDGSAVNSEAAPTLQYQPLEVDGEVSGSVNSEETFESLYPVLRYRWQGKGGATVQ